MIRLQRHSDGSAIPRPEVSDRVPAGAPRPEAEGRPMAAVNRVEAGLTGRLPGSMDADGRPLPGQDGRTLTARRGKETRPVGV